jgi:uncharacterized protein
MNLSPDSPFSSKASQLLSWGHWFTFANITLVLLISTGYLFAESSSNSVLGHSYMFITWLSHTSFITLLAFVLTIFPLSLVFPYPKHIRGMAAAIATVGICLLTLDCFVYYKLGYHLNISSLPKILSLLWDAFADFPIVLTSIVLIFFVVVLCFELIVSNFAWRHLNYLKETNTLKICTAFLVSCFAASHLIHIWADANNYFKITRLDNILPLSYPTTAKTLLARNNLLDLEQYEQERELNLTQKHTELVFNTPPKMCTIANKPLNIFVFDTASSLNKFVSNQNNIIKINGLIQPQSRQDSVFNLLYGLPAIYNSEIEKGNKPFWLKNNSIRISGLPTFNFINSESNKNTVNLKFIKNSEVLNDNDDFIAFNLAPKSNNDDVIYKSNLFTNIDIFKNNSGFKQPSDIIKTLLSKFWRCPEVATQTMIGRDLSKDKLIEGVNFTSGVLVAFKKDRITLVKQDGSFKHVSSAEGFIIQQKLDIPFLIQSIKELKRFENINAILDE